MLLHRFVPQHLILRYVLSSTIIERLILLINFVVCLLNKKKKMLNYNEHGNSELTLWNVYAGDSQDERASLRIVHNFPCPLGGWMDVTLPRKATTRCYQPSLPLQKELRPWDCILIPLFYLLYPQRIYSSRCCEQAEGLIIIFQGNLSRN